MIRLFLYIFLPIISYFGILYSYSRLNIKFRIFIIFVGKFGIFVGKFVFVVGKFDLCPPPGKWAEHVPVVDAWDLLVEEGCIGGGHEVLEELVDAWDSLV